MPHLLSADVSHLKRAAYEQQLEKLKQDGHVKGYEYHCLADGVQVRLTLSDDTTLNCVPAGRSNRDLCEAKEAAARIAVESIAAQDTRPSLEAASTAVGKCI